jgi:hypothetical protein
MNNCHFEGLCFILSHQHKVMHIQYANDILLFIKAEAHMVERVNWILMVFENILGFKNNLDKSKPVPLNINPSLGRYFANILNYTIRKLPLKYLGVKLH